MNSWKVLFVGDVNVDLIFSGLAAFPKPDREVTCDGFEVAMGSSAVIAACKYSSLGGAAAVAGLAGADEYGKFMIDEMKTQGVDVSLVKMSSAVRTGVTANLIQEGIRTQVTFPGAIEEFDGSWLSDEAIKGFSVVHFSGPYLQKSFRPKLTSILRRCSGMGVRTSLDVQWDPTEKWHYLHEWLPHLSYFFCNEAEATSITNASNMVVACAVLAKNTQMPIVKTGRRGAAFIERGCAEVVPGFPVASVDTTGAGDCFDAGFLFGVLERSLATKECVRFANAVAAHSCLYRGGVSPEADRYSLNSFIEKVLS